MPAIPPPPSYIFSAWDLAFGGPERRPARCYFLRSRMKIQITSLASWPEILRCVSGHQPCLLCDMKRSRDSENRVRPQGTRESPGSSPSLSIPAQVLTSSTGMPRSMTPEDSQDRGVHLLEVVLGGKVAIVDDHRGECGSSSAASSASPPPMHHPIAPIAPASHLL